MQRRRQLLRREEQRRGRQAEVLASPGVGEEPAWHMHAAVQYNTLSDCACMHGETACIRQWGDTRLISGRNFCPSQKRPCASRESSKQAPRARSQDASSIYIGTSCQLVTHWESCLKARRPRSLSELTALGGHGWNLVM